VPDKIRLTDRAATQPPGSNQEILNDESGRYLRPGILGPPEGEPHDRQLAVVYCESDSAEGI
jgi:hypothetical protein